jgi:hypothetical protein
MFWSKRPAVPPTAWSSPVITIAALKSWGKYQKRGIGLRSLERSVTRFASRRCCSSACGIGSLPTLTQSGCGSPAALP